MTPRPIVALHGFTGSGRDWNAFSLDAHAPDLPGHAGAPPPRSFEHALETLAREIHGPADLVGYSMGGRLALAFAAAHPARVRTLVLIGASAGIEDPEERRARAAQDERWARLLEEAGLAAFVAKWDAQPLLAGRPRAHLAPHDPHALAAALRVLGPGAQTPVDLARVRCPVLLVAGERDPKYVAIAERLARRIARAGIAVVTGAGHAPHLERPVETRETIERFWRSTIMLPAWKTAAPFEDIRYEKAEGIAKITIARPEVRNAFRPQTVRELERAFDLAREDGEVGVVILTGEGPDAFCAGGDQRVRGEGGYVGADGVPRLNILDVQRKIRSLPKPVIAMVAGYAIGGGHVLHVVCDLTIAAENARFGQTGPRVGSFDGGFGASYLARIVGQKKAREIWFLCRQYDAQAALAMGLVNAVVPLERLEEETVAWCREMLRMSPMALRCLKSGFNAELDGQAGIQELAGNATLLYYLSEEAREGKEAFLEKRAPDFGKFPRRP